MTDQDPYGDPTRVEVPVSDPTQAMPAMAVGPPGGGPPPRRAEPPSEPPDHRGWILAGLFALVLLIGLAVLLLSDDDKTATDTTTTSTTLEGTTSSSSTTTTAPTTTAAPTTTTTPPVTVAPGLCTSGGPNDPDKSAQVLYQAYALGDRSCAEELATADAVDTLFAIPGHGGGWRYQGCTDQTDPDPHVDCAFTFAGGATHFRTSYSATDGWIVFDVYQTTD
jgi:hypothetical protein